MLLVKLSYIVQCYKGCSVGLTWFTIAIPPHIDSMNNVFDVNVNVEVPEVICQFQNGPVASTTCTIEYGTDPTYLNLQNNASSTGTNVTCNSTCCITSTCHSLLLCCVYHGSTNAGHLSYRYMC